MNQIEEVVKCYLFLIFPHYLFLISCLPYPAHIPCLKDNPPSMTKSESKGTSECFNFPVYVSLLKIRWGIYTRLVTNLT